MVGENGCVDRFVTEGRCDRGHGGNMVGVLDVAFVDGAAIMLELCVI